jgi:hypothetical protein
MLTSLIALLDRNTGAKTEPSTDYSKFSLEPPNGLELIRGEYFLCWLFDELWMMN